MENLYLIVGLGNPGSEYARTRHNAGFMAVDRLARHWQAEWTLDSKFNCRIARTEAGGRRLMLCQPQTYMNANGEAVGPLAEYFRIPGSRLLVLVDDADLPLGEIRLRSRGSSGGHHGLESVEQHLASASYARLRIGIGRRQDGARQIRDHVLGHLSPDESVVMARVCERVVQQVECWLNDGIEKAMSKFNGAVNDPAEEQKETE